MDGVPSATSSQFLSKLISVLPPSEKITGMSYMGRTDGTPHLRNVEELMTQLGIRYGKTDSERARSRLKGFAQFPRKPSGNLKDFWARFLRVATRLGTLSMKMSDEMVSPQAPQALKLTVTRLPIAISALGTKHNSHSVDTLKDIAIKMFETYRHTPDLSEVYLDQDQSHVAEDSPDITGSVGPGEVGDDEEYQACYGDDTGVT